MTELERVFHEVVQHEAGGRTEAERAAFLSQACGGDAALAREVEALLAHCQHRTVDLAAPLLPVLADFFPKSDLAAGSMLGPYQIQRKVGEGGMGAVYAAQDSRLVRLVAIKILKHDLGDDREAFARFEREARSSAALTHPNIAATYDFGNSNGAPYLVMEFVPGRSFRSKLAAGVLREPAVLRYAGQLAAALDHAHSQGVVHRDIKPENILIAEDGSLKVIDFGVAGAAHDAGGLPQYGTPAYAAPELLAGAAVTEASDVYSFGVIAYEMACGGRPYGPADDPGYVSACVRNPRLSEGLGALIDRCLARDPLARYRNGLNLAAALRSANSPGVAAVLDFLNIGEEPTLDWLGAGIAETLISRLSKLGSIRLASRAAVRRAAQSHSDPRSIGASLDASWMVTGSFQRSGDLVRVSSQLMRVSTSEIEQSETIDGRWNALFEVQDEVAEWLFRTLGALSGASGAAVQSSAATRSVEAFEQYAKGRQNMYEMKPGALIVAIQHFEQAIAVDPGYALAYSALGTSCMLEYIRTSNPEEVRRAAGYLKRATLLDPELGEPYPWLFNLRIRENDPAGAFAAARKGVEMQPDLPEAQYFFGAAQYMAAESELADLPRGLEALAEAIRLEPKFQAAWLLLGAAAAFGGQHQAAIRILSEAIRMSAEPDLVFRFVGARTLQATAWMRLGDWPKARAAFEAAVEAAKTEPEHHYRECFAALNAIGLGDVAQRTGDWAGAVAHFRQAWRAVKELPRIVGHSRLLIRTAAGLATAYATAGDRDRASELARDAAGQLEEVTGHYSSLTFECSLPQLHLSMAVVMLRLGEADAAEGHLVRAKESGWRDCGWLLADPELEPLRQRPALKNWIEELKAAPPLMVPFPLDTGTG